MYVSITYDSNLYRDARENPDKCLACTYSFPTSTW